ncbi:pyridoxamine 5'-phosphate oxidase [Piedraia hortae CBS 480.64]|uniref:pyridoxal 5'-phosphate synthase n=1 Tax=Piedraia hortae CBS 480.64 TaxID=1314780 RepID=A0A6A7C0Y0_9PEZI|nr:pyridoxamine 5'-phosphate oxidase [Piedraia hortae CBS 480.64]
MSPLKDPATVAQFTLSHLARSSLHPSPHSQFKEWFTTANSLIPSAEAATLSTSILPSGRVSARVIYVKDVDEKGFVFYSNWATSRKARDYESNRFAALTFWWGELERQVRVEGTLERLGREGDQEYFDSRPRGARVGAWASRQSEVIEERGVLDQWVREVEERFRGIEEIPVPEFWGGVRLVPDTVEFWQGRESRLHDRFRYKREGEGWVVERLSP